MEGKLTVSTAQLANAAGAEFVTCGTDAATVGDDLVAAASEAVAVIVQKLVVFALTNAAVVLVDLASGTSALPPVVDKGAGANGADTVDEETVVQLCASCADASLVVGVPGHTSAPTSHDFFVDSTVVASVTVSTGPRASRADLASSVDAAEACNALASLVVPVVDFVGGALLDTDAELVSVEAFIAFAPTSIVVVLGVQGAGHTETLSDEVVRGALFAHLVEDSKARVAHTLAGCGRVGTVLTTDVDAAVSS